MGDAEIAAARARLAERGYPLAEVGMPITVKVLDTQPAPQVE